jgi:hypothetical protein
MFIPITEIGSEKIQSQSRQHLLMCRLVVGLQRHRRHHRLYLKGPENHFVRYLHQRRHQRWLNLLTK